MEILLAVLIVCYVPLLWLRWLAARCFLPSGVRWESASYGAAWACFGAPVVWGIVMWANVSGGSMIFGERAYSSFSTRLDAVTHLWPSWAQAVIYGLPYLLICLAFDWQWGRRNLPRGSESEKSRVVLWALVANGLSLAWIVGLFEVAGHLFNS